MADIEKIQGEAVARIFAELQQKQIPLRILGEESEEPHLTVVTDVRKLRRKLGFLIKDPGEVLKADDDADVRRLHFEFIGEDNIKYLFETGGGEFYRGMIWLELPEVVRRHQRRRLFRLEAPHGTRLYFRFKETRYKLLVINVSLGGSLGVLVSLTKQMEQDLQTYQPRILENIELVFPAKNDTEDNSTVTIKRCRIKRQERNAQTNKYECAIEFMEIAEAEEKKLTHFFYEWQRDFLRKRRRLKV